MKRISNDWIDYKIIDAGFGEKLESWRGITLRRPDPQAIWEADYEKIDWKKVDAHYHRSTKGGGEWEFKRKVPESWTVDYKNLKFKVSPTSFKHTGLFPEQAANWDYIIEKISNSNRPIKVLNLFAYTGGATVAALSAGASVVHVDASKGMIEWAKENVKLSNLEGSDVRFLIDDCIKFVEREERRGNKYDAIIMDPPSYGRGPNGEVWKFEDSILGLINASLKIMSDKPLFMLINSYTTGISSIVLENILKKTVLPIYKNAVIDSGEVGLPVENGNLILPCGIYGRFEIND